MGQTSLKCCADVLLLFICCCLPVALFIHSVYIKLILHIISFFPFFFCAPDECLRMKLSIYKQNEWKIEAFFIFRVPRCVFLDLFIYEQKMLRNLFILLKIFCFVSFDNFFSLYNAIRWYGIGNERYGAMDRMLIVYYPIKLRPIFRISNLTNESNLCCGNLAEKFVGTKE